MNTEITRRTFLKTATAAIGTPTIIPASALGKNGSVAPSNRVVLGGIGLGRRGRRVLDGFFKQKDSQFVATADPQKVRRDIIKDKTNAHYGKHGLPSI